MWLSVWVRVGRRNSQLRFFRPSELSMSQAYQLSAPHPQSPLQRPNVMAMPSSHQHPFQPKPRTKNRQSLKNLAWVELSMSIAMFLLDIIAIVAIINGKGKPSPPCGMGTGIWVGLLGMITAGLGAGAFWNPYANKCLLVSHFVMSIIMTLADAVLIIFSVICQISLPYFLRAGQFSDAATEDHIEGMIWLEFFLLTAGVTHCKYELLSLPHLNVCR